jgi:hypothetical protein
MFLTASNVAGNPSAMCLHRSFQLPLTSSLGESRLKVSTPEDKFAHLHNLLVGGMIGHYIERIFRHRNALLTASMILSRESGAR